MYDVIGDIHGHAEELVQLLESLGYSSRNGLYSHPTRKIVFVGDFIDRGPQIREVLRIVRPMVELGSALAVMGNHEFNAISYHTPRQDRRGEYARIHSAKNVKQHSETVRQVPPGELADHVEWFRTLPLWIELNGIRVVHATWDPQQIDVLKKALAEYGGLSTEFVADGNAKGTALFSAIDDVLKGKEIKLPLGHTLIDKDGHERDKMRTKWYEPPYGHTYASYALSSDTGFPGIPLDNDVVSHPHSYPADDPPVFFGHYLLRADRPERLASNVACVDYSVAKGGMLCAYRWNGELEMLNESFVTVSAK